MRTDSSAAEFTPSYQDTDFLLSRLTLLESVVMSGDAGSELRYDIAQKIGALAAACREARTSAEHLPSRQQHMTEHFRAYCRESVYTGVLDSLDSEPTYTIKERCTNFMDAPPDADGGRSGYIHTGSAGETIAMTLLFAKACGIGQAPHAGEAPLRGLFLIPPARGLRDVEASYYQRFGDGFSIMTYPAFMELPEQVAQSLANETDLLVLDEPFEGITSDISAELRTFMAGKTVLGLTSESPADTSADTQLVLGLDRQVARSTGRQLIEDGIANGAQVLLFGTGQTLQIASRRGLITETDLADLRTNFARNELILDTIQYMAEESRTGIVKAIRGSDAAHATFLVAEASQRTIIDPHTKTPRTLRVAALGSTLPLPERRRILREFQAGSLDALVVTSYLHDTIISERVEYVCDTEPTTNAAQIRELFGLGLIPKDKLTVYIQLIDHLEGKYGGRLCTILEDVLGESRIAPQFTIGQPAQSSSTPHATQKPRPRKAPTPAQPSQQTTEPNPPIQAALELQTMTASLRIAAEKLAGELLANVTIIPTQYKLPQPHWVRLDSLPINQEVSRPTLEKILRELKIPYEKAKIPGGFAIFGPPDTEERLQAYSLPDVASDTLVSFTHTKQILNISQDTLDEAVTALGLRVEERRSAKYNRKRSFCLWPEDFATLEAWVAHKYQLVDPDTDVPVRDIAHELGRHRGIITLYTARHSIAPYPRYTANRYRLDCVTRDHAAQIKQALGARRTS